MEQLETAVRFLGYMGAIGAAIASLYKMHQEIRQIQEGVKCGMRSEMLRTYYRHREEKKIRQYEMENFLMLYAAYKALGGNSFIEEIHQDVTSWEIVS